MPLESIEHSSLIKHGEAYIRQVYSDVRLLSIDSLSPLGTGRLLPLLQYQPDIVANLMDGRTIIGEAKTENDVLRLHSTKQYEAFISYLSQQTPKGMFMIFCSWKVATSVQDWLRNFFRKHNEFDVTCLVISDVDMMRKKNGSTN